jgi:membrane-bound lytic murein transglycosylase D
MPSIRRLTVLAVLGLCVGCGAHVPPAPPPASALPLPVEPVEAPQAHATEVPLPPNPTPDVIARAERELSTGEQELTLGHLVAAREAFDRAVDVLLASPGGARADAVVSTELDKLLDRVSTLEAQALREGDGFTEAKSTPAVIDSLLAAAVEPPKVEATTQELVAADLASTPHDLPIPLNTRVLSYVQLWRGNLHDVMQDALDRSVRYVSMIEDVFKAEGLPVDLAYLPIVESGFKPTALSHAAAKGLWQFEADTGQENGLDLNWFRDDRSDPEKATQAAAKYFKWLLDQCSGDWYMTLAAYNAGVGRVDTAVKRSKLTDYWSLSESSRYLPRDTREYVPMVLASILIAKDPARYGFEIPAVSSYAYERVTVPDAIDLGVLAEWAGVPVDQLRDLNPELRRATTPLGKHELRVPVGTAATIEAKLATADASVFARSQFQWHTVKRGETLSTIARQSGVRTANLASANGVSTKDKVQVGQQLMIPRATATQVPSATRHAAPAPTSTSASASSTTYRVKQGDTLYSIARQFDTTVDNLKHLNQLTTDVIVVGDKLTVKK